ncbi:sodium-coupled monocarboxylate transporter 1-like isoform X1 [Ruditapes philippinarum]|uniref:sodium-coupled monocarboxylate transporter 1-like isoform X1 n=1 Tax=Ruditapes philippinarum TaxID=129788 RepID=UPI00295C06FC|nr:sodium-coupled monocarboxylate transporter 1-like isoform X1 [Ruditapes philippinarum]
MAKEFNTWDWVVFGALLGISALIGVYYAVKSHYNKTADSTGEFLMGGRKIPLLPASVSILVSFMSAITILGAPAEMYTAGTMYFLYLLGLILACVISATIFVPLFYPLKLTSSFQYLEGRFKSKAAKLTGAIIMVVQQIMYMGIATFAPSTALEAVTGFPTWATIVTVGCVSTFYTFLGGMKAVIWTDVFQSTIMVAGLLAITIQGIIKVGSFGEVWKINEDWNRIDFWEANPDPTIRHSIWSLVFGTAVTWTGAFGVTQASVQRYCAVETYKKAKISVLLNILGCIILVVLASLAGVVMFAYYAQSGCDPLSAKEVGNANQLIPYFVMEVLGYPGLPGLFVSCLFSGALSTMSSCLNALAAVCWEDMLKPLIGEKVTESTKTWITRTLVAVFGGAGIGFAFMAQNLGGTVLQASMSFTGAASGPLLGIFLLGGLFPRANAPGCVVGGVLGLVLALWVSIGAYSLPGRGYALDFPTENCSLPEVDNNVTASATPVTLSAVQQFYTLSYLWFSSVGTLSTIIIGLLVSLITSPFVAKHEVDPIYLIPVCDRLCCCFPESWKRVFRCGYEFENPEEYIKDSDNNGEILEKKTSLSDLTVLESKQSSSQSNLGITSDMSQSDRGITNGVTSLAYRQKKSEFIYDNTVFKEDEKNGSQTLFVSSV